MMGIQLAYNDRTGIAVPPSQLVEHDAIRDAVKAYEEAKQRRFEAWTATTDASARQAAIEADASAFADALAAGQPDPGAVHVLEHDAAVADAHRRAQAADVLLDRCVDHVRQTLDEYGGEWIEQLERDHVEAVHAWQHLLDVLVEAEAKMAAAESLRRFAASGRWWAQMADNGTGQAIAALRSAYVSAESVEPVEAA
jgi:hypothetical protein